MNNEILADQGCCHGGNKSLRFHQRLLITLCVLISFLARLSGAEVETEEEDFGKYLQGRYVYKLQCVPCHGITGRGDGPWAAGMPEQPRNFRMGIFKYRTTPMGFQPTEDDLRRTITRGVSGTAMPTFGKTLNDRDLTAVIYYLKSRSPRWRESSRKTNAVPLPDEPSWFSEGKQRLAHAKSGRLMFDQICASCHGETGAGDGPGGANLTNVWGHIEIPADLRVEHHRSGPKRKDLFRTIAMGLDGTPMVGFRGVLKDEQIWELIAVIEDLKQK
ncbi:c-type cytochrome [Verrucomicrobia bacterium]|nr:c-type cytochrome [Verrucomicrobiota bacterium]